MILLLRTIIYYIVQAFSTVLVIYCVSSWFIRDGNNRFMNALSSIVDPVLDPIRNVLSKIPFFNSLPIDFSPIVAFLLCEFIVSLI